MSGTTRDWLFIFAIVIVGALSTLLPYCKDPPGEQPEEGERRGAWTYSYSEPEGKR